MARFAFNWTSLLLPLLIYLLPFQAVSDLSNHYTHKHSTTNVHNRYIIISNIEHLVEKIIFSDNILIFHIKISKGESSFFFNRSSYLGKNNWSTELLHTVEIIIQHCSLIVNFISLQINFHTLLISFLYFPWKALLIHTGN